MTARGKIIFTLLVLGYCFIRRKQVAAHRACMIAAVSTSVLFFISYLTYHYNHGSTRFTGEGWVRPLYFVILITHTILATAAVPFVVTTLVRATRGQFGRHARLARWVLPVWLYVSVTGVIVYLMLYQLY